MSWNTLIFRANCIPSIFEVERCLILGFGQNRHQIQRKNAWNMWSVSSISGQQLPRLSDSYDRGLAPPINLGLPNEQRPANQPMGDRTFSSVINHLIVIGRPISEAADTFYRSDHMQSSSETYPFTFTQRRAWLVKVRGSQVHSNLGRPHKRKLYLKYWTLSVVRCNWIAKTDSTSPVAYK